MQDNEPKQAKTFWKKICSGSGWVLFIMLIWELVEECLETFVAFVISDMITAFFIKALSTFAITQGVKVSIRRFLMPFIKTLTYKEGNDKMSKIKKFFTWIWCNKKTLTGTAASVVMTLSGTGVINVNSLPALNIDGFNITPIIYYACIAILALVGVSGKGFENIKTFLERVGLIKAEKEQKAIIKEAKKELAAEEAKVNQTQAEQEQAEAKAKAKAEAEAKAEREQAEAEHRAKIEAAKAQIIAERSTVVVAKENKDV